MAIKAVFFDLYHTLVRYEPPREEIHAKVLKGLGIDVSPAALSRPLAIADEFIYEEIARLPISKRSEEERMALLMHYEELLLKEAGIKADEQLVRGLLSRTHQAEMKLVLFDDVVPTLTELKGRGLVLGLISNIDRDMTPLFEETGLLSLLRVIVTSQDTGYNKPHPEIFREALRQAGVQASEALYVGDQYRVDVLGANGVGMRGILLDRGDYFSEAADSPRIHSLAQVLDYLS